MVRRPYAAGVSVNRPRLLVLPFGLLAFALRLAATVWATPLTERIRPDGVAVPAVLMVYAASMGVPAGLYHLVVLRSIPRRPASFRLDARSRSFVVSAAPHGGGALAIVVAWIGGGLVLTERAPGADGTRPVEWDLSALTAVLLVFGVLAAVLVLSDRPRITLDADGITVQRMDFRQRIGWNDLLPGSPPPPTDRRPRNVTLYSMRGTAHGAHPVPLQLPVGQMQVDPAFFADAIRHYVDQPGRRSGIGTEAELANLRAQFGNQRR